MHDEAIDWDLVARCEARVRHYGEPHRDEVVRRSGQEPARYSALRERAFGRLTEDAMAGESDRAAAYGAAVAAERRRLERERPSIASLGELHPDAASAGQPAGLAAPPPGPEPAVSSEPPSSPAHPSSAPPASPAPPRPVTAPRFVPSYLREVPAPAEVIHVHVEGVERDEPDATQLPIRRVGPTLPFADAPSGVVPEAVRAAAAAARAERAAEEDADGDASEEAAVDVDATAFLPRTVFDGPATPFEKKKVESAATMALDGDALRAAAASPEPWIPLEEYAAFLGELAQDPSRAGLLRAKYGMAGEDAQRALGAGFAAKFGREPALRARFDALLAAERARHRR